jgi:ABC exporter DevB family membrane fusion protein
MSVLLAAAACAAMIVPHIANREVKANSQEKPERLIAGAGRVEPLSEEIQVGADLYGRIRRVLVEEGQQVRKGETVAILVNDDYQARVALAEASVREHEAALDRLRNGSRPEQRLESEAQFRESEAILANAQADRERKTRLFQGELISRMEFEAAEREFRVAQARSAAARERASMVRDQTRPEDLRRAEAELERSRAQLAEAHAMLAKTLVTSPIDGVVLRKKMKEGESITALSNQPVIVVGDCSRLRVRVDVDETDVARVRLGQTAWVRADAYGSTRFAGKVVRIGRILGRKNIRSDEPAEKTDQKVLETLIELDPGVNIPIGLRVDAYIDPTS